MRLFESIPGSWESFELSEVAEINPTNPENPLGDDELASFVPMKAIEENTGNLDPSETEPWGDIKKGYTRFQENDVLFAKITPSMENGKCALAKNLKNGCGAGTTELHVIRCDEKLLPKFVLHFVLQEGFRRKAEKNMTGSAGQMRVPREFLESAEIPVPPIREQKQIINKIEEFVSQISAGTKELENVSDELDLYKTSVTVAAVEGDLTSDWRKKNNPEIINKKSYTRPESPPTELINIPEDWIWGTVGDVASSLRNGIYKPEKYYTDDGVACLRMYNIVDGEIVWKDIKRMELTDEELEKYKLEPGDFLVNRVNSKKLVGKAAAIPPRLETCVYESKNIRIRLKDNIKPEYLHYWFHIYRRRYFTNILQQTVGQASITQKQLRNMPLPIPPTEEQSEIVNRTESCLSIVEEVRKNVEKQKERSQNLRQSVVKQAFQDNLSPNNMNQVPVETKSETSVTQRHHIQQKLHELGEK